MGFRVCLVAAVLLFEALVQQPVATLRIRITIVDANQQIRPVPRHAVLISENPTQSAPQRAVTNNDGTAEIRLRPGNYTVESDEPLTFQGKAYEWRQTLDVPAGQTTTIELTAANAEVVAASERPASTPSGSSAASGLLLDWQNSVVTIWSPLKRGAGFLIDARGLIATNQRLAGTAKVLEVQLSPAVKVTGRVLVADADRDVAILWIDPKVAAALRPMMLKFADASPPVGDKEKLFAISAPIEDDKRLSSGTVARVTARTVLSDVRLEDEDFGAPLFNANGEVVAITTPPEDDKTTLTAAVRIDQARGAIAAAESKLQQETPPSAARLPIEGDALFPDDPLREAASRRKGPLAPYRVSSADFDVSLITPVLAFSARHQGGERAATRGRASDTRDPVELEAARRALQEFGNWWDYVRRDPPVLMIRATPKMVESFWKSILRGAAQTQGVSLPPIKRIKAGFSRMQLLCGDSEVTPIHPFKIEHRLGETEAVYEGFYIYDPAALGPQCGAVKLNLYSDKAPDKADPRTIDPKILEQIHQDFAPYRTARRK
jgi:S1-C subfamily serine protease